MKKYFWFSGGTILIGFLCYLFIVNNRKELIILSTGNINNIVSTSTQVLNVNLNTTVVSTTSLSNPSVVPNIKPTASLLFGGWSYSYTTDEGYGSEFSLDLVTSSNDKKITGDFLATWNFPNVPAGRINEGTISGTLNSSGTSATVTWKGDRGETGTATITFVPKNKIIWQNNSVSGSDGYTFGDRMIFTRTKSYKN